MSNTINRSLKVHIKFKYKYFFGRSGTFKIDFVFLALIYIRHNKMLCVLLSQLPFIV